MSQAVWSFASKTYIHILPIKKNFILFFCFFFVFFLFFFLPTVRPHVKKSLNILWDLCCFYLENECLSFCHDKNRSMKLPRVLWQSEMSDRDNFISRVDSHWTFLQRAKPNISLLMRIHPLKTDYLWCKVVVVDLRGETKQTKLLWFGNEAEMVILKPC